MVRFIEEEEPAADQPRVPPAPVDAPWHLWVVGGLSLLWNAFGAYDYTMTQSGNAAYLHAAAEQMGVTAQQAYEYFSSFPAWMVAFWALGVWGALAGSVLLLLRTRFAFAAFALSLLGLAVSTAYQVTASSPDWLETSTDSTMTIVIWSVAAFLLIYAFSMTMKRVLR